MATAYLTRTAETPTLGTKCTISCWVKRASSGTGEGLFSAYTDTNERHVFGFNDYNIILFGKQGGSTNVDLETTRMFRDPSAWYHIVCRVDTTESTASDRVKIYVNGSQETAFDTSTYPAQNDILEFQVNSASLSVGAKNHGSFTEHFNGCMTHFHFIDGTAYDASTFGETDSTSGIWKPKTSPSVTYGTNGFFLKMENSSDFGEDSSGNDNDFTTSGTITQTEDTPSNNFCTWNTLDNYYFNGTFINGNTTATTGTSEYTWCTSTLGVSSGKWYWEVEYDAKSGGSDYAYIGITPSTSTSTTEQPLMSNNQYYYYSGGSGEGVTMGDSYTTGDIIGIALDLDNNKIYFSKNGTFQNSGDPTSGATGTGAISITDPASTTSGNYFAIVADGSSSYNATFKANFGNGYFGTTAVSSSNSDSAGLGLFEYSVPSGYYALCTKNIKNYG